MKQLPDRLFSKWVPVATVTLLVLGYAWGVAWGPGVNERPYTSPLAHDTAREKRVWEIAEEIRAKSSLDAMPEILVTASSRGPLSFSEPFSPGAIGISTDMLHDDSPYTDSDVAAIIAHEFAHLENKDTYKFWKRAVADWNRDLESVADRRAAALAGCIAVRDLFDRHYDKAMKSYLNPDDPHPHPDDRIKSAGDCANGFTPTRYRRPLP